MLRRNWTREELIVAFNLYCRIPFGRIHNRNPEIIALAEALGRTPSALSWKLANFARFDPALKKRGIVGATHGGKLEEEVWEEFNGNWETLAYTSEKLRAKLLPASSQPIETQNFPDGKEREITAKARVNQGFFRAAILAAYNGQCCITGLSIPDLLTASHIIPWKDSAENRTNPKNGLCLNALHDRAFDRGLITLTDEYTVQLSSRIPKTCDPATQSMLRSYAGAKIQLPSRFYPAPEFLAYHRQYIYIV